MTMRITNNMVSDRVISDLQARYAQLANTQLSISTGRRVNSPSDDPIAASQERLRQSQLEGVQSAQKSVASTQSWLNQAEASVSGVTDVLARAKEIATTGAHGAHH